MSFAISSVRDALGIPSVQIPISRDTFASHVVPCVVSYTAIAVLAITPQTRALRIALWPVVALCALRLAHIDLSFGRREFQYFNGELVRFMVCFVAHSLSWTWAKKPLVRHLRPANSSPSTIMDALDLVTSLRGHGWDWSRGLHVPRETRPTGRIAFAFYTFLSAVVNFFLCSVFHQAVQTFTAGSRSSAQGLSIYDDTLPAAVRYLRAGVITALAGLMTLPGTQMNYELATVLGVLLFRQDPAQWPRAFDQPWRATSLSELWGRRWHQSFRHTLLVCARPFYRAFGRAGGVVGVFLASGLVHHLILLAYDGRSALWRMLVGFGMMAPGVLAERAFYGVTGRKVGGVLGWVWTATWLTVWGNFIIEGFMQAGMYAQPNAIKSEFPLWAWVDCWVATFDAWLHAVSFEAD